MAGFLGPVFNAIVSDAVSQKTGTPPTNPFTGGPFGSPSPSPVAAAPSAAAPSPAGNQGPTSPPAIGAAAPVARITPAPTPSAPTPVNGGGPLTPTPSLPVSAQQTMFDWGGPHFWGSIISALSPQQQATNLLPQLGIAPSPQFAFAPGG